MKRTISLLMVLLFVAPLPAQEVQVVAGPEGGPRIEYATQTGPDAELRIGFSAGTPIGVLEGELADSDTTLTSALSLDGRPVAALTLSDPPDSFDVQEIVLEFGELGRMVYHNDNTAGTLTLMQHSVTDCEALRDSPGFRAIDLLWQGIAENAEALPSMPEPAAQWIPLLTLYARLPRLVEDCSGLYRPEGQCNWDTPRPDYERCTNCCETMFSIAEFCTSITVFCSMRFKQCRPVAMFCGGAATLERDLCKQLECTGLPGDPSCPPEQTCDGRVDGASCYVICPIGARRVCGSCSDGSQTECCVR